MRLENVGYGFLTMNEAARTASLAHQGNGVDLGGIGKGAACDAAVEVYRASDVDAAIVAVGAASGFTGASRTIRTGWLRCVIPMENKTIRWAYWRCRMGLFHLRQL